MAFDFAAARRDMVRSQLVDRGIRDERVLRAMAEVPREAFVAEDLAAYAHDDGPLPIASGQTISQPLMVATMMEAAEIGPTDRVLEIGTGSGYGAAVLARLAASVHTIERDEALFESARERLLSFNAEHVVARLGDGADGWSTAAPFDAIVLTAAPRTIPPALVTQLARGGRLIAPVGNRRRQHLIRIRRGADGISEERLGRVMFVPML